MKTRSSKEVARGVSIAILIVAGLVSGCTTAKNPGQAVRMAGSSMLGLSKAEHVPATFVAWGNLLEREPVSLRVKGTGYETFWVLPQYKRTLTSETKARLSELKRLVNDIEVGDASPGLGDRMEKQLQRIKIFKSRRVTFFEIEIVAAGEGKKIAESELEKCQAIVQARPSDSGYRKTRQELKSVISSYQKIIEGLEKTKNDPLFDITKYNVMSFIVDAELEMVE